MPDAGKLTGALGGHGQDAQGRYRARLQQFCGHWPLNPESTAGISQLVLLLLATQAHAASRVRRADTVIRQRTK